MGLPVKLIIVVQCWMFFLFFFLEGRNKKLTWDARLDVCNHENVGLVPKSMGGGPVVNLPFVVRHC